jgi:hypothetical protein
MYIMDVMSIHLSAYFISKTTKQQILMEYITGKGSHTCITFIIVKYRISTQVLQGLPARLQLQVNDLVICFCNAWPAGLHVNSDIQMIRVNFGLYLSSTVTTLKLQ